MSGKETDERSEKDFYKKPGGGLIDPQGEPPADAPERGDETITEPTEELPPKGLGKKSPDQTLSTRRTGAAPARPPGPPPAEKADVEDRHAENPPASPRDGLIPEDTTPAGTDRSSG